MAKRKTPIFLPNPNVQNIHRRQFPKKQQYPRYRDPSCVKKQRNYCAHANTAETSGHNALPALPRQTLRPRCGDSSAGVRRAVRDIRLRHPRSQNYDNFSSYLFFEHTESPALQKRAYAYSLTNPTAIEALRSCS
jgi:hypothetical protein